MSVESHKAVVRRYCEELFTGGKLEVADEILSDSFVFNGPFGTIRSRAEFKQFAAMMHVAFNDFHMTVDFSIAEGDRVASRFTMYGTHHGNYHGIPATGQPIAVPGINIFRFENDHIVEVGAVIDSLKMMQQIGMVAGRS